MNARRAAVPLLIVVGLVAALARPATGQGGAPLAIEPVELGRRDDLANKPVVVEDRVARIQFHPGRDFDQIFLKRAPSVVMELPESLRFKKSPQAPAVRVTGIVRREGNRWWVDVTAVDLLPADLDRLNSALATTPRVDVEKRLAWVRWAETRAEAFADETLRARARQIEVEILRDEAERPGRDPSGHWLGLARRARSRGLPEPEPSALAHRGFRAALASTTDADELKGLVDRIAGFFPESARPLDPGAPVDLERWRRAYEADPAAAYRSATETERKALDRALWADASVKLLERRARGAPADALSLADDAARRLPDRPEAANALYTQAADAAAKAPGALTTAEVDRLDEILRGRLNLPEKADALRRDWLYARRRTLQGTRDAEGRIELAGRFEAMLNDRETALDLLREAAAVEPDSPQVAEAYLLRGYRKVGGRWVDGRAAASEKADAGGADGDGEPPPPRPAGAGPSPRADGLIGATPDQVRARMGGKPTRRAVNATQGQIIEQWIYSDPREDRYVNFLHRPGDPRPRVVSYFSLPRGPRRNDRAGN